MAGAHRATFLARDLCKRSGSGSTAIDSRSTGGAIVKDEGGRVQVRFDDDEDVKIVNVRAATCRAARNRPKAAPVVDHLRQAPQFVREKRISITANGHWYYALSLCIRSGQGPQQLQDSG